ncbi:hypothetical protein BGZ76_008365 [Entomortierella beljakovae]|nr:hypothetical protein BGZ76_008365 [Entomortierella beljakovae]
MAHDKTTAKSLFSNRINMVRTILIAMAVMLFVSVEATSCQDQAGNGQVICRESTTTPCPAGYRPVFYDDPTPCKSGQRCCIKG